MNMYNLLYPWLFPGGIVIVYDEVRGRLNQMYGLDKSLKMWVQHLLRYYDWQFQQCQLFTLYVLNAIQRQENNKKGSYFYSDKNCYVNNSPFLEDLKYQIRNRIFTFISKLCYYSQAICGTDSYWRKKLFSWIDFHVSRRHGPPTHFITHTCTENW